MSSRGVASGFAYVIAGLIGLSLVGGALSSIDDQSPGSTLSGFAPSSQTEYYESRSGRYSIELPTQYSQRGPYEGDDPTLLTPQTGRLATHTVSIGADANVYFIREVTLPSARPADEPLAGQRCAFNQAGTVPSAITVAGHSAWQCEWTDPNGKRVDEVFLVVGDTALLLRGEEWEPIFFDSTFNAMVGSLTLLRSD